MDHQRPTLVAHRGFPHRFPGNTLISIEAALATGVRYLEVDIQFSADRVPFLYHDADLARMSGVSGSFHARDSAAIEELEAYDPEQFGEQFRGVRIPRLSQCCELLAQRLETTLFVELKPENLGFWSAESIVQETVAILGSLSQRCVLISFSEELIQAIQSLPDMPCAWILSEWSDGARAQAEHLGPEYLFCNKKRLPSAGPLWSGPWQWVIYTVDDWKTAEALKARGVEFVETDAIGELLSPSDGHQR